MVIASGIAVNGVHYLPDVTSEMSSASFWTEENEVFMTYEEIEKLNEETIHTKGTNMYDLKNQPETVDGIALNESLIKSSGADAEYFLSWTYFENGERSTKEGFDKIIENTSKIVVIRKIFFIPLYLQTSRRKEYLLQKDCSKVVFSLNIVS